MTPRALCLLRDGGGAGQGRAGWLALQRPNMAPCKAYVRGGGCPTAEDYLYGSVYVRCFREAPATFSLSQSLVSRACHEAASPLASRRRVRP